MNKLTYEEALEYIHSQKRYGWKLDLSRVRRLLLMLGNPQYKTKFIHVAGTKGKGSVTAMTTNALRHAGYKTGMYISPYLQDFRERISLNGENISCDDLIAGVERISPLVKNINAMGDPLTEWEIVTAIAFDFYAAQKCDIVALEVGMGGRSDATNLIDTPLVSVITSITCDEHKEILGDTPSKIANEKAGIIKPCGITVSAPNQSEEVLNVITKRAEDLNNALIIPDMSMVKIKSAGIDGTLFTYKDIDLTLPLIGEHQVINCVTAVEALSAANIPVEAIQAGIATVKWPARFEILSRNPFIILDGAHNPSGIDFLCKTVKNLFPGRKITALMGMFKDKEYFYCIERIAAISAKFIATQPDSERAVLDCSEAADIARKFCPDAAARHNIGEAVAEALNGGAEVILICGSLDLAGSVRSIICKD